MDASTFKEQGVGERGPVVGQEKKQKPWLSVLEAAEVLGIHRDTLYGAIRENKVSFEWMRIGGQIRISAKSLGLGCGEETGQ